jgi:hypothetical protein
MLKYNSSAIVNCHPGSPINDAYIIQTKISAVLLTRSSITDIYLLSDAFLCGRGWPWHSIGFVHFLATNWLTSHASVRLLLDLHHSMSYEFYTLGYTNSFFHTTTVLTVAMLPSIPRRHVIIQVTHASQSSLVKVTGLWAGRPGFDYEQSGTPPPVTTGPKVRQPRHMGWAGHVARISDIKNKFGWGGCEEESTVKT